MHASDAGVRPEGTRLVDERHDGAGATVVALHAGVADRRCWRETIAHLHGGATVVSYDRRGYGETPPSSAPFSNLDDLVLVLEELDEPTVWLLGNSMGGQLALDLARRAPDRVAGLILLAPDVSGAPEQTLDPDTQRLSDLIDQALAARNLDELNRFETWLWLDGPSSKQGPNAGEGSRARGVRGAERYGPSPVPGGASGGGRIARRSARALRSRGEPHARSARIQ
jgi:pimeloyl-ACP methyl ester carboxylesterase